MSPFVLSDADLAATTPLAALRRERTTVDSVMTELFGDEFTRTLHREDAYEVPLYERRTCPKHSDWRSACIHLHLKAA